jgi:hypothetical protein
MVASVERSGLNLLVYNPDLVRGQVCPEYKKTSKNIAVITDFQDTEDILSTFLDYLDKNSHISSQKSPFDDFFRSPIKH